MLEEGTLRRRTFHVRIDSFPEDYWRRNFFDLGYGFKIVIIQIKHLLSRGGTDYGVKVLAQVYAPVFIREVNAVTVPLGKVCNIECKIGRDNSNDTAEYWITTDMKITEK